MPVTISIRSAEAHKAAADVIVVGLFNNSLGKRGAKGDKHSPLAALDRALGGTLHKLIAKEDFKANKDPKA